MKAILLALGLILPGMEMHDFFVSICTIRYRAETKTLDITWRMTTHDVEFALSQALDGADLALGTRNEHGLADSALAELLISELELSTSDVPLRVMYLGKEVEQDELFCYLQVVGVDRPDTLKVRNTLLKDIYPEQENVVHFEIDGRTRSYSFIGPDTRTTFIVER